MTKKKKKRRSIKNVIKKIAIAFFSIVLFLILILFLSISYAKYSENDIQNLGEVYQNIVLQNVNIIPMEIDTVLYNKNIYIENNTIVNITPDSILIDGYKTINAHGKFAMPGLIDMHAHVFDRTDLPQYLAHGVTTVRNMMGFPMHLRWKQQLKEGRLQGSKLITATPTINSGENAGPFHKTISNAEEASLVVEAYIDAGYDFVKVYDDIDSLQLKAIEKASQQKKVDIAGHPPKVSLERLLNSSLASIEHTEELLKFLDEARSEESIRSLAKKIKASNKAIALNLLAFNRINRISQEGFQYYTSLQKEYLNPVTKFIGKQQLEIYTNAGPKYKAYANTKYNAMENLSRIFADEGVTIVLGTDSEPNFIVAGVSVLEEMQLLKSAGLSHYDILKSATYNAAMVLDNKKLGKIATSARADLLVLNENPLANFETLSSPNMLLSNGNLYSSKELLEIRQIGEDKQNTYATLGLFLEHLLNK